jgi:hypothetical protein
MILALFREVGLAAATMILSVFGMSFLYLTLANYGLVSPEGLNFSAYLLYSAFPFTVGGGALFAVLRQRLLDQRPIWESILAALSVGMLIIILLGQIVVHDFFWTTFFLLPGFALWGGLSGWIASRRRARGLGR